MQEFASLNMDDVVRDRRGLHVFPIQLWTLTHIYIRCEGLYRREREDACTYDIEIPRRSRIVSAGSTPCLLFPPDKYTLARRFSFYSSREQTMYSFIRNFFHHACVITRTTCVRPSMSFTARARYIFHPYSWSKLFRNIDMRFSGERFSGHWQRRRKLTNGAMLCHCCFPPAITSHIRH